MNFQVQYYTDYCSYCCTYIYWWCLSCCTMMLLWRVPSTGGQESSTVGKTLAQQLYCILLDASSTRHYSAVILFMKECCRLSVTVLLVSRVCTAYITVQRCVMARRELRGFEDTRNCAIMKCLRCQQVPQRTTKVQLQTFTTTKSTQSQLATPMSHRTPPFPWLDQRPTR